MANRLAVSLSPYLRQHADNPVDWYEWGEEAFAEARRRDVPILLSAGYAACHWCHVMAHESFEDPGVAARLNDGFVAIKVDREERPDVDAVYMNVTQALTGHGGWPMTVLMTPSAEPFYAGTYLPREQFLGVLAMITQLWNDDRERVETTARSIVEAMRSRTAGAGRASGLAVDAPAAPGVESVDLTRAVARLAAHFDTANGGFGGAPKFPPSMTLEHLLRHHARTGGTDALTMVESTAEAMACGGMYDQLDGGFARYSVDAYWVVPHFEKMLYDNAQLLRVYAHLLRVNDSAIARRVVDQTAGFLLRRLRTSNGAFASALDADTEGVEGATYVWTREQLVDVLGERDAEIAARMFVVTGDGTFEHGASTLQWRDVDDLPGDEWVESVRARLLAARDDRPQPMRDNKVVTSWNGLAVAALVEAGMIAERPEWVRAARGAADAVLRTHVVDGRLRRMSLDGRVGDALGCADDHGNLAEGLMLLHQATGDPAYLDAALSLLDSAVALFLDDEGVHDTGSDAPALFVRPRSQGDNAEPSDASSLASAFVMAFALTGNTTWREHAERCLSGLSDLMKIDPRFAGWALATAEALAAGPLQVAVVEPVVGPGGAELAGDGAGGGDRLGADHAGSSGEGEAMWRRAWMSTSPGLVRVRGTSDAAGVPLLADRPAVGGRATAYVCRGFVCNAPVSEAARMAV